MIGWLVAATLAIAGVVLVAQFLRLRSQASLAVHQAELAEIAQAALQNELEIEQAINERLLASSTDFDRLRTCVLHRVTGSNVASPSFVVLWDPSTHTGSLHGLADHTEPATSEFRLTAHLQSRGSVATNALVFQSRVPPDFSRGVFKFVPSSGDVIGFTLTIVPPEAESPAATFLGYFSR